MEANRKFQIGSLRKNGGKTWRCLMQEGIIAGVIVHIHDNVTVSCFFLMFSGV